MASDIALDADVMDIGFDGADFALVEDAAEVAQRVRCKLTTQLGEYQYNTKLGLPWIGVLLGADASYELRTGLLYGAIARTEGIREITKFVVDIAPNAHSASIDFSATTIYGEDVDVRFTV